MNRDPVAVAIALGSNLGDRRAHLDDAVRALRSVGRILAVSSFRETAPVGGPPQPDYLNGAVTLSTAKTPLELLHAAQAIEGRAGRERGVVWGPRTLDLDLLLYGDRIVSDTEFDVATSVTTSDGRFSFFGVPPGPFLLRAQIMTLPVPVAFAAPADASEPTLFAAHTVSVGTTDIVDLTVPMAEAFTVRYPRAASKRKST